MIICDLSGKIRLYINNDGDRNKMYGRVFVCSGTRVSGYFSPHQIERTMPPPLCRLSHANLVFLDAMRLNHDYPGKP